MAYTPTEPRPAPGLPCGVVDVPELPEWMAEWPEPALEPWPTVEELIAQAEAVTSAGTAPAGSDARAGAATGAATDGGDAVRGGEVSRGASEWWRWTDAELMAELAAALRAVTVAQGWWLSALAEAERRQVTVREHSVPTASWLSAGPTHSARAARADVRLARLLEEHAPVGEAVRAGFVSNEQAAAILDGLDRLPEQLDEGQRGQVAAHLVDLAAEFNPPALRRLVNRAVEVLAPDVAEDADRCALERAERSQHATRHVGWATDRDDGGLRFWGKLGAIEGDLFRQHLSALADSQRAADSRMGVDTSPGQALADALLLVVAHHASCQGGPAKGGDHTRVVVTLDLHTLISGVGTATLVEPDQHLTAGQVRRLACTAGLIP